MFFRRRFGRRRAYRKTGLRKRRGGVRSKVSKSVKRFVKKAIHRQLENKEIIYYAANQPCATWDSTNNGFSTALTPSPSQGTGDSYRVGNEIRVVKGIIKGHINILPYNATTNPNALPCWVKIWILRDLTSSAQFSSTSGGAFALFRGNSAVLPPQGNMLDMSLPVNQDYWRVITTKTFKLGTATSTGTGGTVGYYDNSPVSHPFYFDFTKHLKKVLKYQEGTSLCNNHNLYMMVQVVDAHGSSSGGKVPAEIHYVQTYKFEDA